MSTNETRAREKAHELLGYGPWPSCRDAGCPWDRQDACNRLTAFVQASEVRIEAAEAAKAVADQSLADARAGWDIEKRRAVAGERIILRLAPCVCPFPRVHCPGICGTPCDACLYGRLASTPPSAANLADANVARLSEQRASLIEQRDALKAPTPICPYNVSCPTPTLCHEGCLEKKINETTDGKTRYTLAEMEATLAAELPPGAAVCALCGAPMSNERGDFVPHDCPNLPPPSTVQGMTTLGINSPRLICLVTHCRCTTLTGECMCVAAGEQCRRCGAAMREWTPQHPNAAAELPPDGHGPKERP